MNAFKPKGRTMYEVKVPTSTGWVKRPTKTRDRNTARKMQQMVDQLGPQGLRAMDVLDAVRDCDLTIPALWDRWVATGGDLAKVRALLADMDLLAKRAGWLAEVRTHASEDTAQHYDHYLDSLVESVGAGKALPRSRVTIEAIKSWLAALSLQTGTKRKYHAGVSSFFAYCVSVGALERNPMRDVKAPPAGKARDRHLSAEEARGLADAQPTPYREFSALLAGTGVEVSVALALTVKDIDIAHREIRARGTKSHNRDRVCRVADWAWPDIQRAIAGKMKDARLFDTIPNRWDAQKAHDDACTAKGIRDYTMRDARHTWAVRMAKAGVPIEQIIKQLGHKDAVMALKVYGVYAPTQAERDHWERIATARDAATATEKKG